MKPRIIAPFVVSVLAPSASAWAFNPVSPEPTPIIAIPGTPSSVLGKQVRIPICDLGEMPDNIASLTCEYIDLSTVSGCNVNFDAKTATPPAPRNASYGTLLLSKYGSESDPEPITMSWGNAEVRNAARMRCTVGTGDPSANHDTIYFASMYMAPGESILATAAGRNEVPIPRTVSATFAYTSQFAMEFAIQVKDGVAWSDVAVKRGSPYEETVQLRAEIPGFATTRIVVRTPSPLPFSWSFSLRQAEMFIEGCDGPDSVCFPE